MPIDCQKRDDVAYITLNNPRMANILDKKTSDEISAVNGWAAGAGMYILPASTDIRIAGAEQRGDAWPEPSEEDAKRLDDVYRSGKV